MATRDRAGTLYAESSNYRPNSLIVAGVGEIFIRWEAGARWAEICIYSPTMQINIHHSLPAFFQKTRN